jgi:hypothetical protein
MPTNAQRADRAAMKPTATLFPPWCKRNPRRGSGRGLVPPPAGATPRAPPRCLAAAQRREPGERRREERDSARLGSRVHLDFVDGTDEIVFPVAADRHGDRRARYAAVTAGIGRGIGTAREAQVGVGAVEKDLGVAVEVEESDLIPYVVADGADVEDVEAAIEAVIFAILYVEAETAAAAGAVDGEGAEVWSGSDVLA